MIYCKDIQGYLRRVAYGTFNQNWSLIQNPARVKEMLRQTLNIHTNGAVLVLVK